MQTLRFFSGVLKLCLSFVPYRSTFFAKRVQNQQKKHTHPNEPACQVPLFLLFFFYVCFPQRIFRD